MKQFKRRHVEHWDEAHFLQCLEQLGTSEDLTDIIAYLSSSRPMTTQRLSYLLYFSYAWGLVLLHREIAPLKLVQTCYGPIELMHRKIYPLYDLVPSGERPKLDHQLQLLLDMVITTYGNTPIRELELRVGEHMHEVKPGSAIGARDVWLFFTKAISYEPEKDPDKVEPGEPLNVPF